MGENIEGRGDSPEGAKERLEAAQKREEEIVRETLALLTEAGEEKVPDTLAKVKQLSQDFVGLYGLDIGENPSFASVALEVIEKYDPKTAFRALYDVAELQIFSLALKSGNLGQARTPRVFHDMERIDPGSTDGLPKV
jgi:hypothetical protein